MAEVPVTINGVIYPKAKGGVDQPVPCVIQGLAVITGLGVGGGPSEPPPGIWGGPPNWVDNTLPPGRPPHIWGGAPPWVDNTLPQPPQAPDVPEGTPPSTVVKEPSPGSWGTYTDANGAPYSAYRSVAQPK